MSWKPLKVALVALGLPLVAGGVAGGLVEGGVWLATRPRLAAFIEAHPGGVVIGSIIFLGGALLLLASGAAKEIAEDICPDE